MNNDQSIRLSELLERWCDGTLTEQEGKELESALTDQPEAMARYIEHMEMHSRLTRLIKLPSNQPSLMERPLELNDSDPNAKQSHLPVQPSKYWLWGVMLAASILGAIFVYNLPIEETFVARVIKKIDCDIESARWESQVSNQWDAGRTVTLNKGLLALEFGCGATVVLEGPAEFEIVSAWKCMLHSGKLTAHAPDQAKNFTVETPSSKAVDLGKSFGVQVDDDGVSEVHVFEGEVHVFDKSREDDGTKDRVTLLTNQASRVGNSIDPPTEFSANSKSFVQLPKPDVRPSISDKALPFDADDGLVLWLDANKQVQTDDADRVVSWGDQTIAGNSDPENAWQVDVDKRPYLVPNSINGKSAVRFLGNENLVTEPIRTGKDVSVFLVGKLLPREPTSSVPSNFLSLGSPRNISLVRYHEDYLASYVLGPWRKGRHETSGWLSVKNNMTEIPLVIATVYSHTLDHSHLIVNGEDMGTSGAWIDISINSPRFIGCESDGRHRLVGDIAEILIFDSMLESETLNKTSQWLIEKHSIEPGLGVPGKPIVESGQKP